MMKKVGLRRRWLLNTVGVVSAVGLLLTLVVTGFYAWNCYDAMERDLTNRAEAAAAYFAGDQSPDAEWLKSQCAAYTVDFGQQGTLLLQFYDREGTLFANSSCFWGWSPSSDTAEALASQQTVSFCGKDGHSGKRILSVSAPVSAGSGELLGAFRFVTATAAVDKQILTVALTGLGMAAAAVLLILLTSRVFISSLMKPVAAITEKAKRIAAGSYGVQIVGKYPDEIGDLSETVNDLSSKLSQNEKMQAEFISSLSHELRTPLTVITGWSETLLSNEDLAPDDRRGMGIILRESKRLNEMVVELLDFTRIQGDRMTLNVAPADIRADFEDTVFMYSSRLSQDGIELEYLENDEDIPEIPCDIKRMRQVFLNILDNAAKHGGDGKRIQASIHYEGESVVIRIRDFGPGIPEDEIPLVKKKFYKGSSKARGTGIGLAVCDEIVEMHSGSLILSNAPGGGTLVTVSLPAAQ